MDENVLEDLRRKTFKFKEENDTMILLQKANFSLQEKFFEPSKVRFQSK
ncbi:hypothetical protein [Anoxybacter fermentans]|nr:hypothetical protein [Anoxybacter fermentans]